MKLKGTMVIELTDVDTGDVETYTEENMVTNAVNNILGANPLGLFYNVTSGSNTMLDWNDYLLPICPNMIGGILLFSNTLDEDVDNIYPQSDNLPVAYASNDVNGTTDLARGSLNQTESKALDNGYKFVWEFTASQGNGTIAAAALTGSLGGQFAYGNDIGDTTAYLQVNQMAMDADFSDQQVLFETVSIDFDNEVLYSFDWSDSSVVIKKARIPITSIGLVELLNDTTITLIDETVITPSTFKFTTSYYSYGAFMDGQDGYWYGFANGSGNSSGSASMTWIKISKTDYSYTEGSWTLSNATLKSVGYRYLASNYMYFYQYACVRDGYLYVMAYDAAGIYKINISNSADVTLIDLGFTSAWKAVGETGSAAGVYMLRVQDLIIGYDFILTANDTVIATVGSTKFGLLCTQMFQYKNFLIGWGCAIGTNYRQAYLLTPYMATINNLDSSVVKDSSKTMKITYTLTEADSE